MALNGPSSPKSNNTSGPGETLRGVINARIDRRELTDDPAQHNTITALDDLLAQLRAPKRANKGSALGWLFGRRPEPASVPRGLYIWGGVGRGKSMLMDTFFALAPTEPKQRIHFHAFMRDVHQRIHTWRKAQKSAKDRSADPIPPLADDLAKRAKLLCFDEFAVTDVADAMILARLFTGLFQRGVTVVATSNVRPDELYKNGLNRSFFLPFIDLVKTRMEVMKLASDTDHRMGILADSQIYMTGEDRHDQLQGLWDSMTAGLTVEPASVDVAGRTLSFPRTCGGMVFTDFPTLCQQPLGANDYLALTERFHTLFLGGIPVMEIADRNAAKRFIALVDTLYDGGRHLIVSAETEPAALYTATHGTEAFEFDRTISRLQEMQGKDWPPTG